MEKVILKHDTVKHLNGVRVELQSRYMSRFNRRMYRYKIDELPMSPYITLDKLNGYLKQYGIRVATR